MIVRSFTATATPDGAARYAKFFQGTLVAALAAIEGHRGAVVLDRADGTCTLITVLTFWDSMEAVRRFAGDDPGRAVIEPEARELFLSFDEKVDHWTVRVDTR